MTPDTLIALIDLCYLASAACFILAFKLLAHPRTAVRGNVLGALGMALAIGATLAQPEIKHTNTSYMLIGAGLLLGTIFGVLLAVKVPMTGMPQMVGLLNGLGGGASFLVAAAEVNIVDPAHAPAFGKFLIASAASGWIGGVTLTGSLVAFAKLQELAFTKPVHFRAQQLINAALCVLSLVVTFWLAQGHENAELAYWLLVVLGCVLGVLLTIPIGGADMPVVICLLNSYSGLAACATGFVINNNVLIISGSLVGASGLILTRTMCKAMNRSLTNVLFGIFQPAAGGPSADQIYAGKVKSASPEEIAMLFDSARKVVIVPGYGLAVSQAQHAVHDLMDALEAKGTEVLFGIHPVAGRMPGHMNVLLAEAEIPYDKMVEMNDINPSFVETDVAMIIGANDVVNPMARTDPNCPIAGMPILDVDKAKSVVVIKRSLSPGFAGIPNPLFAAPNTLMYFADGKEAVLALVAAIKAS